MAEDIFDAIIVGGGVAGATTALVLARAGCDVLVVERGNFAGSKNMTGGRLYAHSLESIIPGFAEEAPVERLVVREKITMMTADSGITLDYQLPGCAPSAASWTVLRSSFDQWLMGKAEDAGAQVITGVRVDELIRKDGKICGVKAGDDEIESRAVILADGVNSLLAKQAGIAQKINAPTVAVGVKELIELSPTQMLDRFGCTGNTGTAWLFAGAPSCGHMGGGFLYTNKTSVSLGLVMGLHNVSKFPHSIPQMLEDFKNHPIVAPLISGGRLLEYSAHMVPEGGLKMVTELVGDGIVVAGDAAGMCLKIGYTVRGMDLAIASGEAAAKAIIKAKENEDFSRYGLGMYRDLLEQSFIMNDLKLYQNIPDLMNNPRLFTQYPGLMADLMHEVFSVTGPQRPLRNKLFPHIKKIGLFNLFKDGLKGVRSL